MAALWALMSLTLKQIISDRKLYIVLIINLMPAGLILLLDISSPSHFHHLMFYYVLHPQLILTVLSYGVSGVAQELQDATATYLFMGSIPRWCILAVRYIVLGALLSLIICMSLLSSFLALGGGGEYLQRHFEPAIGEEIVKEIMPSEDMPKYCWIGAMGVLALLSFCMFCGALFKRPFTIALLACMIWEIVIAFTPTYLSYFTVTNSMRGLIRNVIYGTDYRPVQLVKKVVPGLPDVGHAMLFLIAVITLFLIGAALAIMSRNVEGRRAEI